MAATAQGQRCRCRRASQPAWEVPRVCRTGGGPWGGAEEMGVAGCRWGNGSRDFLRHFIGLGNQREALSVAVSQGRDAMKYAFYSACGREKGVLAAGERPVGALLQHRNKLKPLSIGFCLL